MDFGLFFADGFGEGCVSFAFLAGRGGWLGSWDIGGNSFR
jgi:hypothetical protein